MRIKGILTLAFAAVMGCMHGGAQSEAKSSTVSEADVGRLGPEQEALVDQARQALANAGDALSRTNLRLQEAQNEEGTAKADQHAAESDQKVADAQQKVANDSRAPDALEKARQLQEQAKAHKLAADAHLEYANKLIDQRKAEMQAAEQQVKVAQARVEWSKLQALEQAKNPAATKYDPGRFQTEVSDAQGNLDKAVQKAHDLEAQATAARQRWEDSQRRLQAQDEGSGNQTGTGSGK
jgi:colicin import membrane protein